MSNLQFLAIIVGQESIPNLHLSTVMKRIIGKENIMRYLEQRHLLEDLSDHHSRPIGIFFDLFNYDLTEATNTIDYIRKQYPHMVFCLHMSAEDYTSSWEKLPMQWQKRLKHYFKVFKAFDDMELEPIVRRILQLVAGEANMNSTRLSKSMSAQSNSLPPHIKKTKKHAEDTIFISYSRSDWKDFVSPLVKQLENKGLPIWVDQHLLEGGDDWMDAIGEALDLCRMMILVMSLQSLQSTFVRMEYRYFVHHQKPLIPLLYKPVDSIPFELATIQYIQYPDMSETQGFEKLMKFINKHRIT